MKLTSPKRRQRKKHEDRPGKTNRFHRRRRKIARLWTSRKGRGIPVPLMDDLKYNGSGYRDVTAERAIRKTDKQPQEVTDLVEIFKKIADLQGYEIRGRIGFKNKHTGIIYK